MSLDYLTKLADDIYYLTYNIPDSDSIDISLTIICSAKLVPIETYQDILDFENSTKTEFENYYREYLANNLPPETFNGRESVFNYINSFLNGIDFITYPNFQSEIVAYKYDSINTNTLFDDSYFKNY